MHTRCARMPFQLSFSIPSSTPSSHCCHSSSFKLSKRFRASPLVGCGIRMLLILVPSSCSRISIKISSCPRHQSESFLSLGHLTFVRHLIISEMRFMCLLSASSWESDKRILARLSFSEEEEDKGEGAARLPCDEGNGSTSILCISSGRRVNSTATIDQGAPQLSANQSRDRGLSSRFGCSHVSGNCLRFFE